MGRSLAKRWGECGTVCGGGEELTCVDRSLLNIARQRHGPVGARVGVAPSMEGPAQPARAVEEGGRGALAAGGSSRVVEFRGVEATRRW